MHTIQKPFSYYIVYITGKNDMPDKKKNIITSHQSNPSDSTHKYLNLHNSSEVSAAFPVSST